MSFSDFFLLLLHTPCRHNKSISTQPKLQHVLGLRSSRLHKLINIITAVTFDSETNSAFTTSKSSPSSYIYIRQDMNHRRVDQISYRSIYDVVNLY